NDLRPRQIQDFIPTPMAIATTMYYTGIDPLSGKPVAVVTDLRSKRLMKALLYWWDRSKWPLAREALRKAGRADLIGRGPGALVPPEYGDQRPPPVGATAGRRRGRRPGAQARRAHGRRRPSRAPKTLKATDHPDLGAEVLRRIKASYRPVLVVLSGAAVGERVVVDRTLVVGRDPEAGLTLTDALVSWHHASIEDRGDSWSVVDLDSTNGTFVNGERIEESPLRPNDKIGFGQTVVSFELQDEL